MKTSVVIVVIGLFLFCSGRAQDQPATGIGHIDKRKGEPDCLQINEDHRAMAQAVEKARKSLGRFITALDSPAANQSRFAIKKAFFEGDKVEHLWLNEVRFDGRLFHATIDNEPVHLARFRLGEEVTVSPSEISDWMYVQNGRLVGGYTIRCLCRRLSPAEKKQFEEDAQCRVD